MNDAYYRDTYRSLLGGLAILVMLLLVSLHPVFGFSSHGKFLLPPVNFSYKQPLTPSGSNSGPSSSTSARTPQTPSTTNIDKESTIKTVVSKAVITCVNSTIKNALIDAISKCKRFYTNRSYICKSYYDRYNELYQQDREWINKQGQYLGKLLTLSSSV